MEKDVRTQIETLWHSSNQDIYAYAQKVLKHYATSSAGGQPYGIVDPDYARVYTQARVVAWQYGYACVMHGSFTRDLDLLLVPWTEEARDNKEQLLKLIAEGCGLRFSDGKEDPVYSKVDFTDKPHGRKACTLYFPKFGDRRWVDISFTPLGSTSKTEEAKDE